MTELKPGDQPYNTSNAILAFCLHMAGVPWMDNYPPVRVLYSAAILQGFTNGTGEPYYKGWTLEKAVEHAHKTGRRGHVEYIFKRTDRLPVLTKAYRDQVEQLEKAEGFAHELVKEISMKSMPSDVMMLRLACIFLKMRVPFMEMWQHAVPRVIIKNEGRVARRRTPEGGEIIESPGFKIVSLNASEETRKELGI
jgi:hypothetical protein